jgi:serine/threonine-protein kinase RsbW
MQEKISFISRLENIVFAERFIKDLFADSNYCKELCNDIQIAVTEAIINAIVHGNRMNAKKFVYVMAKIEDGTAFFTIRDEGKGFDFMDIADPTTTENIESPNGRGVFLMNKLATKVTFLDHGRIVNIEFELKKRKRI